ncbi:hypothetical protein LJR030_004484 [Rhizobium sp. LjRoot30]|uniref:hypothetical protein n=1 Tax=Rhizobium sp. LjRoot30 TaxID=3342320 RepID=UPI003ECC6FAE
MFKFLSRQRETEIGSLVVLPPTFVDLGRIDLSQRRADEKRVAFTRDYTSGQVVSEPEPWVC